MDIPPVSDKWKLKCCSCGLPRFVIHVFPDGQASVPVIVRNPNGYAARL